MSSRSPFQDVDAIVTAFITEVDRRQIGASGHGGHSGGPGAQYVTMEAAKRATAGGVFMGRARRIAEEMQECIENGKGPGVCSTCDRLRNEVLSMAEELQGQLPPGQLSQIKGLLGK